MYLLISIGTNDTRTSELVCKSKKALENHIAEKGFYWSKKCNRYIDDKNCGISGGGGTDYLIELINEL